VTAEPCPLSGLPKHPLQELQVSDSAKQPLATVEISCRVEEEGGRGTILV
jgi:hypothetical protein